MPIKEMIINNLTKAFLSIYKYNHFIKITNIENQKKVLTFIKKEKNIF